jgi:hypothetical protein
MPDPTWRPGEQHPEAWRQDLNPNVMAGQNVGMAGPHPEVNAATAFDLKSAHRSLEGLTDADLKQIPILPPGNRLEQGATYLDLQSPRRHEFKARGDMVAGPDNWYVPKDRVDYELWNRLIGVANRERLGEAEQT